MCDQLLIKACWLIKPQSIKRNPLPSLSRVLPDQSHLDYVINFFFPKESYMRTQLHSLNEKSGSVIKPPKTQSQSDQSSLHTSKIWRARKFVNLPPPSFKSMSRAPSCARCVLCTSTNVERHGHIFQLAMFKTAHCWMFVYIYYLFSVT